ncbi:MAG TPA: glycosyltransferase family A protein [Galbitalea sp.]|nr:glycosyltransferase family A protein [Galbitalea sp.]
MRLTAVLPVFNGAPFIDAALDSIVVQTRKPDEIIVVDDGSTDDSAAVIAAAKLRLGAIPIVVISQANFGQSAARNTAVDRSSGDLIAFLDQDDRWHPEHLAVLAKGFGSDPSLGWTYSDFDEIDGGSKLITRRYLSTHRVAQPKSDVGGYLVQDAMILPTATVVRTSALRAVGGFDSRLSGYEDDDLFLRLFRAGWTCRFEARALAEFRVHPTSSSGRASFRISREIYFDKVSDDLPDDPRLNRYYVTDLLLPRMLAASLSDYAIALSLRDDANAREIALSATRMSSSVRMSARRRFGLAVIRHPRLCRFSLRLLRRLPRWMRPRVAVAFRLN